MTPILLSIIMITSHVKTMAVIFIQTPISVIRPMAIATALYYSSDGSNCMTNPGVLFNPTEWDEYLMTHPGTRYTLDQQCYFIYGEGSFFCGVSVVTLGPSVVITVNIKRVRYSSVRSLKPDWRSGTNTLTVRQLWGISSAPALLCLNSAIKKISSHSKHRKYVRMYEHVLAVFKSWDD